MAQKIVGVDLGTYSVKAVTLAPKSRATPGRAVARTAFDVLAVGEVEVAPPAEGEDAAATLRERQGEALAELKRRRFVDGDLFVTGLPGDEAAMKTLIFPFNDKDKIAEALPFSLESEISLDLDDVVYPYIHVDRRDQRDPRRAKEAEVLTAFARKDAVQEVLNTLAVHGIDPRHIELDALALDDLWEGVFAAHDADEGPTLMTVGGTVIETTDGAPAAAVAIVDVGHRRTSVCVLRDGKVVSAHTLLHGGADATRALAREIGLSLDEAERGKRKEAFLEVAGAVAQFPEQQQISDVLKKAHAPLVRRLRQIFQASISTSRLRIVKVVLTGGGSKVLNLDRHLGEELNVKVVRGRELSVLARALKKSSAVDEVGESAWAEFAMAFSYALAGLGNSRAPRIDFRVGPFAWKGDYDFLRERVPALGAWAAALLLVVGVGSIAQAVMLSREESALVEQQLTICREITGDPKLTSTSTCGALIRERIAGTGGFQVPEHSAVDTFIEVSRRLPYANELKRKVTELDITNERVRLKGTTTTYEAIDTMVERLQGGQCFQLVEKGKARNINADSVEMNITINLDCAASPGDNKVIPPPPAPTAASLAASAAASPSPTTASRPTPTETVRSPPPDEPPEPSEDVKRPPKSSPEQLEARRERLRKLREERDARRRQLIDNPGARGSVRDRFQKAVPLRGIEADADGAEGDE